MDTSRTKRIDIISDTHGHLTDELLGQLEGADLIVHAGDITSESDWALLCALGPQIKAVLGNNDFYYDYGPEVERLNLFDYEGLSFAVSHYREDLPVGMVDVGICGHTHRARVDELGHCTVVNPGSPSMPRGRRGPTMARMLVRDGKVLSTEIVDL